ncbi:GntR family transcriptional regulator [Pelagovum pacificum]|uniref:GntR family transcriptional regulator n=1 Tax=Pelagovum pacificum TaxID=2588711 RepID=UPI0018CE2C3B|nr:GntR family transcriptional regulator [Pelagovum pacificum]QQA43635.1 GntR family transcriptional regulator [Pelagovum pacificum]
MSRPDTREFQAFHRQDKGSITSQVHALLLNRILDMDLKPFDELSEARLASELGVSRTPVREALARLARRNLVDIYPQRGTFISPINIQRVTKARFIREALERPLARAAAESLSPEVESLMEREIALQTTFANLGDDSSFLQSDDSFHILIARAAGFDNIWEDVGEVRIHMDRIRRLSLLSKARMLKITEEHTEIFEAIRSRDPDRAEASARAHLQSVFTDLDKIRGEHPEYFYDATTAGQPGA